MSKSWRATLVAAALILFGFIWNTYYPESAFETFSVAIGGIFGWYTGKRHLDKKAARATEELIVADRSRT